jgi:hypothetical protein
LYILLSPREKMYINPLTSELNPSAQRCLLRYFTVDFSFKVLTARRLYKSFGVKRLYIFCRPILTKCERIFIIIPIIQSHINTLYVLRYGYWSTRIQMQILKYVYWSIYAEIYTGVWLLKYMYWYAHIEVWKVKYIIFYWSTCIDMHTLKYVDILKCDYCNRFI